MNIEKARAKAIKYNLSGPEWALDGGIFIGHIRERIGSDGGCGPGNFGDRLVPDSILGVNIKPACYLHDCRYSEADTPEKKYEGDVELFTNSAKIIHIESANKFTKWIRMRIVFHYFAAVDIGGGGFTA